MKKNVENTETYIELPDGVAVSDVKKLLHSKGWLGLLAYIQAETTMLYLDFKKAETVEDLKYLQGQVLAWEVIRELPETLIESLEFTEQQNEEEEENV